MGGSAFTSGPDALYTPRMPFAVYDAMRSRCHAVLRTLFAVVATPVEGPDKADFGDVDILMALPKDTSVDLFSLLEEATTRLGAVRTAIVAQASKASMAVPWPADFLHSIPRDESRDESREDGAAAYVQVDISIAPSLSSLNWALFKHGHGDIWNILGSAVLRPLGFTIDERALWLRVPEIESVHRARAKIFLTDDPATVLRFLGLRVPVTHEGALDASTGLWVKSFASAQDLFEYCTTCLFFTLPEEREYDRRRMLHRPLFRKWTDEFLPACREAAKQQGCTTFPAAGSINRDAARNAAFKYFPGVQERFESTYLGWVRERHLIAVRAAVKAAVPANLPHKYRASLCAAVRRSLGLIADESLRISTSISAAEKAAASWTIESVTAYIQEEWPAIAENLIPAEHKLYLASLEGADTEKQG